MNENIDKTINATCEWIQKRLKNNISDKDESISKMIKALAELVSARG